jgi:hypothetical protein
MSRALYVPVLRLFPVLVPDRQWFPASVLHCRGSPVPSCLDPSQYRLCRPVPSALDRLKSPVLYVPVLRPFPVPDRRWFRESDRYRPLFQVPSCPDLSQLRPYRPSFPVLYVQVLRPFPAPVPGRRPLPALCASGLSRCCPVRRDPVCCRSPCIPCILKCPGPALRPGKESRRPGLFSVR